MYKFSFFSLFSHIFSFVTLNAVSFFAFNLGYYHSIIISLIITKYCLCFRLFQSRSQKRYKLDEVIGSLENKALKADEELALQILVGH